MGVRILFFCCPIWLKKVYSWLFNVRRVAISVKKMSLTFEPVYCVQYHSKEKEPGNVDFSTFLSSLTHGEGGI